MVGVRDRKRKVVTLYPAAGDQVTMLHPRLHAAQDDASEGDASPTGKDPSERQKRYQKKSLLVQAFGSTRRCAVLMHSHHMLCTRDGVSINVLYLPMKTPPCLSFSCRPLTCVVWTN